MPIVSRAALETSLFDSVDDWLRGLCDSISVAATEAYAAGSFHAVGQMKAGLSFDVVQKDALEYAKQYRENLIKQGTIPVSAPVIDEAGNPVMQAVKTRGAGTYQVIKRTEQNISWLVGKQQKISGEIADIIRDGIAEGKPTGIRQLPNGSYPKGSIAADLQNYFNAYKSQASTIARTETARNYFHGEQSRYAKAGIKYVQYLGAPDACEECQPYIGQVFELGTEPPLPIHPNCRCDYRPLTKHDAEYPEDIPDV